MESLTQAGTGNGLNVSMTNASTASRGINVSQASIGQGVFSSSSGGNAPQGVTGSISAAAFVGDSSSGEVVVGPSVGHQLRRVVHRHRRGRRAP